jgi:hypothetical protein
MAPSGRGPVARKEEGIVEGIFQGARRRCVHSRRYAGLVACALLWLPMLAQAQDPDEDMPSLSVSEALALHQAPKAWMVNPVTCERVSAVTDAAGRLIGEGGGVALYRQEKPDRPFMRITTRTDSAYVARFPASPGEVIISRAYVRHPRTNQYVYGRATEVVCSHNDVAVGEVTVTTGAVEAEATP